MFHLKCKSYFIPMEVSHIHECLCETKEIAEALVKEWQAFRGKEYRYKILELDEVNPKKFKHLSTYAATNKMSLPQSFS